VLRGGSWSTGPQYCRAAYRNWFAPANRYGFIGFRVCFRLD
jgi:formylglycine-generating enzyme required for sulfatase activity